MRTDYLPPDLARLLMARLSTRHRLICTVMAATGLRISDVLRLTRAQVEKGRVTVRELKTGKSRRVQIPAAARREILRLTDPRRSRWAFPGRDPRRPLTRQAVYYAVKRAAAGLPGGRNLAPHSWRKAYAVNLFARVGDLERVRAALNHDNLNTTLLYAFADKLPRKRPKNKS